MNIERGKQKGKVGGCSRRAKRTNSREEGNRTVKSENSRGVKQKSRTCQGGTVRNYSGLCLMSQLLLRRDTVPSRRRRSRITGHALKYKYSSIGSHNAIAIVNTGKDISANKHRKSSSRPVDQEGRDLVSRCCPRSCPFVCSRSFC